MGQPKALLPVTAGGVTFFEAVVAATAGLGFQAVVTSFPLECSLPTAHQPDPDRGQLSSLLLGWERFGSGRPWVMVCLVDHPYVKRETYETLVGAVDDEFWLWTPVFEGRGGHPVVFSARLMAELAAAPLPDGARPVIHRHQEQRCYVEVDDPAIRWDIDTPEDYARYSESAEVFRPD